MQYKVPSELTCTADRVSAWRLDEVKLGNTLGFSSWQLAAPFSHRCAAIAVHTAAQHMRASKGQAHTLSPCRAHRFHLQVSLYTRSDSAMRLCRHACCSSYVVVLSSLQPYYTEPLTDNLTLQTTAQLPTEDTSSY